MHPRIREEDAENTEKERDLALGWKKRYEASRDAGRLKSFDD